MRLKEYIKEILNSIDKSDLDIGVTFEIELDEDCNVKTGGGQKVRFSCKSK